MLGRSLVVLLNQELSEASPRRFAAVAGVVDGSRAVMLQGPRKAFVYTLDDEFRLDFQQEFRGGRRLMAHGVTSDISAAAGSSVSWTGGAGLEQLGADYPFVRFSGLQAAYERGDAREYQWKTILKLVDGNYSTFRELVVRAYRNDVLRSLFPHIGHRFALAADEYSDDVLVTVFVIRPEWYATFTSAGDGFEFEGDASDMVTYLATRLGG